MKIPIAATLLCVPAIFFACTSNHKSSTVTSQLTGQGFGISNATLIVQNIDSARNYFNNVLGFKMPEKFEKIFYDGTVSAYLRFADWSAIELLAVKDTAAVEKKFSFIRTFEKKHHGVGFYSLYTSSVDSTIGWLKSRGFQPDTAYAGRATTEMPKGWDWDDGGPQYRTVSMKEKSPPAYYPSFLEFLDMPWEEINKEWKPYLWRKYYESHPNGAVGISSLDIVVGNLETARKEFSNMGLKEESVNDTMAIFSVANRHKLRLLSPKFSGDAANDFLNERGPGVYAVCFEVKSFKETYAFLQKTLPAKAMIADPSGKHLTVLKDYGQGIQIEFTEEPEEQASLAKIFSYQDDQKLDNPSSQHASALYAKYCALCHGGDRQGYTADNAPSLRSQTLLSTTMVPRSSYNFLVHTISYGRSGTAMAPYAKSQGGPLDGDEIELLIKWLHEKGGDPKPVEMSVKPIAGNVAGGKALYAKYCAACHGAKGEGISAPALGNPLLLATASDALLHYTIANGRDGTPMPSFKDSLSATNINDLTAYLRSRASGWNAPEAIKRKAGPVTYLLHPNNAAPKFTLKAGRYVPAEQVVKAVKDSARMIILDARSEAAWHQTHIPGAVSVPYYEEPDKFVKNIPNDGTWVLVYCACPHAASDKVVSTLRRLGYKNTAILDEGILVWAQRGYPVESDK